MSDEVVAAIWRRRVAWSKAADQLKARIVYARGAALILNASGALLATLAATCFSSQPDVRTACAALGAVSLATATYLTTRLLTVDALRAWTRARSVSEAIKAEVYGFRAGAAPYRGQDATAQLQEKTSAVQAQAQDLEIHVASVDPGLVTPPPALSQDDYIATRVEGQIKGYYRKKALEYARRLKRLRSTEFGLGLAGTALGAIAAFQSSQPAAQAAGVGLSAWVGVLTTLAAALAAHVAANRYDFLVMSYYGTARRLEDLVNKWRSAADKGDAAWSAFVKSCEEAISVENESWLAKWMEKDPGEK